jgi:hypothetical protein
VAQIMLIEPDELAVIALKKIFLGDGEVSLITVDDIKNGLELLNGSPEKKEVFEKLNSKAEAIKNELQIATSNALNAKTIYERASELLQKYEKQIENLNTPEAKDSKITTAPLSSGESEPDHQEQKKNLESEIIRLRIEIQKQKDALQEASKVKEEKEKILTVQEKARDEAKAELPNEANLIYSVLMISCKLLTPTVNDWIENFKKSIFFDLNKDIKIIVLGFEADEKTVRKYLNPRVSDYMIKPIDELLARQNIKFLALKDNKAKREVYTLQIKETVDLVFEYELDSLSEVSFQIKSKEEFQINDFKVFNSELFLRKGQKSVLGKCISSKKSSDEIFLSEFFFVGVDSQLLFQILNVIKNVSK